MALSGRQLGALGLGVDLGCLKFIGASRIIVVAGGILGVVGGACGTADPDDGAGGERGSGGIGEFTLNSPAIHGLGDVAQCQPLGVRAADLKAAEIVGSILGRDGVSGIGADNTPDEAVCIIGAGHELGGAAGLHRLTGGVFGDHRGLVGNGLFGLDGERSHFSLADRNVQREAGRAVVGFHIDLSSVAAGGCGGAGEVHIRAHIAQLQALRDAAGIAAALDIAQALVHGDGTDVLVHRTADVGVGIGAKAEQADHKAEHQGHGHHAFHLLGFHRFILPCGFALRSDIYDCVFF